jgi:hypothetical protein
MEKIDFIIILIAVPFSVTVAYFISTANWSNNSAPETSAASVPVKKTIEFHCGGDASNPYDLNLNCQSESF